MEISDNSDAEASPINPIDEGRLEPSGPSENKEEVPKEETIVTKGNTHSTIDKK